MKLHLFNLLFFVGNFAMAQVGIGTNTPSANAALDVNSTNKGLMLPRVNDTTLVSSPSAGLLIFNKAVNAPAFHNGTQWNTFATQSTAASSGMDSITYTITNAATGFTNGTFPVVSISNGASNPNTASNQNAGPSSFQDVAFVKPLDINSIAISKAVATALAQPSMVIEFKMYANAGDVTPYYSIKCTNIAFNSFSIGLSAAGNGFAEQITLSPVIFGYKNWGNLATYGWNQVTRLVVAY